MIFVDSDIFLIDLRYARDKRFGVNARFLERLRRRGDGLTTVFNVLEVCGILSFNLSPQQLREAYAHFPARYGVGIMPGHGLGILLPQLNVFSILKVMERKASLGDAQIIALLRMLRPGPEVVVTWNTNHFVGRLEASVVTPVEAMRTL